ncbi:lysylphosphatidylglycerol synthase domain-containing protein, partial [Microbacterium ulmi]
MAALRLLSLSRRARAILRAGAGAGILIAVLVAVGGGAFVRGLAAVSPLTVAAALALSAVATVAAAVRWHTVARRLDVPIRLSAAVAACYRSQLLNSVLPGGVVGDVHRAVAHGLDVGRVAQASRAVAAERIGGQIVQLVFAASVLVIIGARAYEPVAGALGLAAVVAAVV